MTSISVSSILQDAFNRKRGRNSAYSKSALARDIGVSASFLSNVFTAKKHVPPDLLEKLSFALELDSVEKNQLTEAVVIEKNKKSKLFEIVKNSLNSKIQSKSLERQSTEMSVNLLTQWYYLAVLEGLSTEDGKKNPDGLAKRLGLSEYQFKDAIDFLSSNKLIVQKDGRWMKSESHLYFPVGRSKSSVRNFHKQMIEKAKTDLETKVSEDDFQVRKYLGFTFSANPENIEKIKSKIQNILSELTIEAGEGECTEVYQCNLQLFPLTGDRK